MKKCMKILFLTLMAVLSSGVWGAANWTDGGGDHLWNNPDNWKASSTNKPPASADTTYVRFSDLVSGGQGPIIQDGMNAVARSLAVEVGNGSLIEMTMTGGTLTLYNPGSTGCYFRLGAGSSSGKAVFNMSGGVLTVNQDNGADGYVRVGYGYRGEMYMSNDATVYALDLLIGTTGAKGIVDLKDQSQIILDGDERGDIQGFIDAQVLTAWGGNGTVIYDYDVINPGKTTIRAIPGIITPGLGEYVVAGNVELTWVNREPNMPGDDVFVDVWFGTDPNKLNPATYTKVVSRGQNTTSVIVQAPEEGTYYWQVDSYIYGTTDPASILEGFVYYFYAVEDLPPSVNSGPDMITWVLQPVPLNAVVTDDGKSQVTILWEGNDPNAVFSNPSIANPTVTLDYPAGAVQATVTVQDESNPPISDTLIIHVYANPCQAARVGARLAAAYPEDLAGDCIIDLEDVAIMAAKWLYDYALTSPIPVP